MAQSLVKVYLHIIFSTKNREDLIKKEKTSEVFAYIGGMINNMGSQCISVGGTANHIHILCTLTSTTDISKFVKKIKVSSSTWLNTVSSLLTQDRFAWQKGYAAFSVSKSGVDAVKRYIDNQEAHHSRQGFKNELLGFLNLYEVDYDERYLWT